MVLGGSCPLLFGKCVNFLGHGEHMGLFGGDSPEEDGLSDEHVGDWVEVVSVGGCGERTVQVAAAVGLGADSSEDGGGEFCDHGVWE